MHTLYKNITRIFYKNNDPQICPKITNKLRTIEVLL